MGDAAGGDPIGSRPPAPDTRAALERRAAAGDPTAQTELGCALEAAGRGEAAWEWWRRAAFAGAEPAMRHLARALREPHPDEALLWRWHAVVAARQQTLPDPPAAVSAAATGLGPLRMTLGRGGPATAAAASGCGALAALALAAGGAFALAGGATVLAAALLAVAAAGLVAAAASRFRTRGHGHVGVWLYADGLVERDGHGRLTARRFTDPVRPTPPDDAFPPGEGAVLRHVLDHRGGPSGGSSRSVS